MMIRSLLSWLDRRTDARIGRNSGVVVRALHSSMHALSSATRSRIDRQSMLDGGVDDFCLARRARKFVQRYPEGGLRVSLQYAFATLLIAGCAYVMRRLRAFHSRLGGIYERSRFELAQLIAFGLLVPVFKLHDLLFQLAYAVSEFRLRKLGFHGTGLSGQDDRLKLNNLAAHHLCIAQAKHRLRQLSARLQRREEA